MTTWIALLRGINVGGKNILPMKDLVLLLLKLGFEGVKTCIQSGNIVFRSSNKKRNEIAQRIATAIESNYGFRIPVLLLSVVEFQQAINENPFPAATDNPKTLHLFFLAEPPDTPNQAALNDLKLANEKFVLTQRMFYLHAPQGIGRSKLAKRVEKLLGVAVTARNWQTVCKVAEMVRQFER